MSRNFFPAAQRRVRRMEEALGMRPSDDRHRIAGARDPVAFAYPSDKRCAGRSDGALRQPFSPCPPAVPAQSSGPYGLKTPQHRQPLSPDAHAVCAMRGNNGKDRKANLAGGSLLTKMRKAYALFTFCKSP